MEQFEIRRSKVPDSGEGLFTRFSISGGVILGYYHGVVKPTNRLRFSEMQYSVGISETCSLVGENLFCKINDNVRPAALEYDDVLAILDGRSDLPRHRGYRHNVAFCIRGSVREPQVGVVSIRDIPKESELYIDYGAGFWLSWFALSGFLHGCEDFVRSVNRYFDNDGVV